MFLFFFIDFYQNCFIGYEICNVIVVFNDYFFLEIFVSSKSSIFNLDIVIKLNVCILFVFNIKIQNDLYLVLFKEILNYKLFFDCDLNFLSCMDMKEVYDVLIDFGEFKEEEKDNKFKIDVLLEEVNLMGGNMNQVCQRIWKRLIKREV